MHTPRLLVLVLSLLTAGIHGQLQQQVQQPAPGPVVPPSNGGHILAGVTQQPGLPNSKAPGAPSGGTVTDPTIHVIDIKMPGVRPHQEDQYMCTSAQMPADPQYIINFEALASVDRAHHLLVYGCDQPASISPWDCRSICQRQGPKILYAWARNAPPTRMPPDVGFQVGVKGVRSLVLQIHYKKAVPQSEPADTSGVRLTLSKQRQKYIAGIFLLLRYSLHMPPHTPVIHGDISCKYNGATPLYPFGYRVHAHSLSPVISAYQNNGSWSLLGKGNPQWPQAFYPINEQHEIKPGDLLFARCTYDTTNRATPTNIGGNHDDEMCNFYMMYYTEAQRGQSYFMCNSNNYPNLFTNLPAGNDVPPPPNPALEEEATHAHPHHAHALSEHDEVNNVVNEEVTANNKVLNVTPSLSPGKDAVTTNEALNGPAVEETKGWPALAAEDGITLGQVAGVAVDKLGNIHVFHRASRVWERSSFDMMNRFNPALGPIKENTIIVFNPQGKVLRQWGANLFYMPHGLHLDDQDNVWVTDVGLHQVFKFNKDSATPSLSLGNKLRPGSGDGQFCKPTDVGTLTTGEFYVTDGYCNSRVLKYSADGKLLKQWGTSTKVVGADHLPPPGSFDIPHSVTVLEKRGWVCVADRENGRIQCFTTAGDFIKQFHHKEFAGRLFAVSYSAVTDTLYAVNGPDLYNNQVAVRGFSIHLDTGNLMETWGPKEGFKNPHDLAVSPQGDFIYVAELDPHKVWRMYVHTEVLEAQKAKKAGPLSHPSSVDGGVDNTEVKETEQGDLGASLVIGALLVVPVIFIVAVTVFMRLRKNGKNKGYKKAKLLEEGESDEEDDSLS